MTYVYWLFWKYTWSIRRPLRWVGSLTIIPKLSREYFACALVSSKASTLKCVFYHITYLLRVKLKKELVAQNRRDIWNLSDCDLTITQIVNERVFVYETSVCGFESHCSHLYKRFHESYLYDACSLSFQVYITNPILENPLFFV